MKKSLGWIVLISLMVACQSDPKDAETETPELTNEENLVDETVDTVLNLESIRSFESLGFTTLAKSKIEGFDWSKFRMTDVWKEDSMYTYKFEPSSDFYENYGRFLKYSPDSSYFIDLDSYNLNIYKDKQGNWIGEELGPDTEVALVNPKTGEKTRLLFFGPGASVEDAIWLDDDNIALLGIKDDWESGSMVSVWKYHLPTQTFYSYEFKDGADAESLINLWRKERLAGVKIR